MAHSREPAPVRGPIFIVGAMGSGTTLLRLMLDSHESIAIPPETGFMRIYSSIRTIPFKWSGRRWAQRLGWADDELDVEARKFFETVFRRYADEHGAQRWGEKTPQHTWHIAAMKRVFPESVFIGLIRHPGAAVASNMRRFGHSARWATTHWERYNKELARHAAKHPRRMILLRYEDLVRDPEPVMRELIDWLGEPWSDSVLEHHVVQAERDHPLAEGQTRPDEAIDASRIAKWAAGVSAEDREHIERRLARVGEFYGYSFEDPEALGPLGDSSSLLFGGKEVRARIEQFPDLDIPTRGEIPIAERLLHPELVQLIDNPLGGARFKPGEPDPLAPPPKPPPPKPPPSLGRRVVSRLGRAARRARRSP